MRNLKRALSLAMAAAMLLGMMVIGAGAASNYADFTDKDEIFNKEAVALLVDLGIIDGKTATTYAPKDTLERAAISKLIYKIKMGNADESVYKGLNTGLTDVNGKTWAEGFINYCVGADIIAGVSATEFKPASDLTVAATAKTLLVALGYNAADRGYIGNSWAINVMRDAQSNGLLEGIGQGANDKITRDNAAQMIFNALFAKTREATYGRDQGEEYVTGYTVHSTTLGEETYKLQKVEGVVTGISGNGKAIISGVATDLTAAPDQVGVNVVYYKNSATGKLISSALAAGKSTILGTSTSGAALADLSNTDKAVYIATADTGVTYYLNGSRADAAAVASPAVGAIVDLIDNDNNGKYDVVRVTEKTVATVGGNGVTVSKATSASREDAVTVNGTELVSIPVSRIVGYEDLVSGDVILYVKVGNIFYIEKAATVEGQISGTKNSVWGTGYVLSGTPYYRSGLKNESAAVVDPFNGFSNFSKDIALYLDDNGTVVAIKLLEQAAPAQYAVVTASAWVGGNGGLASSKYAEAQLAFTDGTSDIVRISKVTKADGTVVNFKYAAGSMDDDTDVQNALNKTFYTYTVDSVTGAYALTEIKAPATVKDINADGKITRGVVNFTKDSEGNAIKGNSATTFIIATPKADGTVSYSVKNGIANAPVYTGTESSKATGRVLVAKTGFATIVYISNGDKASSAVANDMAYFLSTSYTYYPGTSTTPAYREYDAIVKGEITTVKVRNDVSGTVTANLMKVTYSDGYITTVAAEDDDNSAAAAHEGTVKAANALVGFGNGSNVEYFTYTDNTLVFFIDATAGTATAGTIDDITTDANDKVYYTVASATSDPTQPLTYVYITKVANQGGTSGGESTGFSVSNFNVVGGAGKATISATVTGKSAADTGDITIKYTPSRMTENGTWVELATVTDSTTYDMNQTTPVSVSIDYNGTPGYLYKFVVEITYKNETTTFASSNVEITAAPANP